MKKNIIALIALLCLNICFAQDKNMLAKIAYEDAETAYSTGNIIEAIRELNKVDSLLGKKTPKVAYLRVQVALLAAENTPSNIDAAIECCKNYFKLSKSFDIPEEKVMDVTRIFAKLKAQKASLAEKKLKDSIQIINDSIEKVKKLSLLFFADGWELGQSVESAQKKIPKYFLKTKVETSKIFPDLKLITSQAEPKLAIYVNSNNKIIGFRKITETKKIFTYMDHEVDRDGREVFISNEYKKAFGFEPSSFSIKGRKGGKKWTKDGKTGIVSWVKHSALSFYAEFYEDLIDDSIK